VVWSSIAGAPGHYGCGNGGRHGGWLHSNGLLNDQAERAASTTHRRARRSDQLITAIHRPAFGGIRVGAVMNFLRKILADKVAIGMIAASVLVVGSVQISQADPATQPAGPAPVDPAESILAEYDPQAPPNPNPPTYTLLRFNEDYRYLADPKSRTDLFDPLKFIPLNPIDPNSYLSFGGSIRERYEHYTAPGFGVPGQPNQTDDLLQRITLDADLHVNRHLRFFVEGISGLQIGTDTPPSPVQEDTVDLQQAFADLRFDVDGTKQPEYLVVRGGRFEMSAGSGRLIATRDGPNIPFKFDGLEVIAAANDAKLYAFLTKPSREQKYDFNDEFPGQLFWGVYGTTPPLSKTLGLRADFYYLGLDNDQASYPHFHGTEERHTFGTRMFGKATGFDYDIEPIAQFGRIGNRRIVAWSIGSSEGYTFDTTWYPRLGIEADIASGDTGRAGGGSLGTFNPLFFKAGFFNDASLIRPSNIIDMHPTLQLQPRDNLLLTLGSETLWRYTTNDGVYGPAGNLELPVGAGSRYIAATAEISTQWEINRHLNLIGSYAHFFDGGYIHNARGHDVDFVGAWLTFTF
jgi:hypothetical protein